VVDPSPLSNTTPGGRMRWISLLFSTELQEQGSGGPLSSIQDNSRSKDKVDMSPLSNTTPGARKWWTSLLSPTQIQEQG